MIIYIGTGAPAQVFQQDSQRPFQHVIARLGIGDHQRLSAGNLHLRIAQPTGFGHRLFQFVHRLPR